MPAIQIPTPTRTNDRLGSNEGGLGYVHILGGLCVLVLLSAALHIARSFRRASTDSIQMVTRRPASAHRLSQMDRVVSNSGTNTGRTVYHSGGTRYAFLHDDMMVNAQALPQATNSTSNERSHRPRYPPHSPGRNSNFIRVASHPLDDYLPRYSPPPPQYEFQELDSDSDVSSLEESQAD